MAPSTKRYWTKCEEDTLVKFVNENTSRTDDWAELPSSLERKSYLQVLLTRREGVRTDDRSQLTEKQAHTKILSLASSASKTSKKPSWVDIARLA